MTCVLYHDIFTPGFDLKRYLVYSSNSNSAFFLCRCCLCLCNAQTRAGTSFWVCWPLKSFNHNGDPVSLIDGKSLHRLERNSKNVSWATKQGFNLGLKFSIIGLHLTICIKDAKMCQCSSNECLGTCLWFKSRIPCKSKETHKRFRLLKSTVCVRVLVGRGGLCRGGLGVNRGISFALTFDGGGIDTLRGGAVTAWCMLSHTEDEISFP